MSDRLTEFREFREKMNARIHESGNLEIKRFFALDSRAYEEGALPVKTKELLGLVASLVLRCDDCVTYHIVRCREEGVTRDEFFETFNVALVVGGRSRFPTCAAPWQRWTRWRRGGMTMAGAIRALEGERPSRRASGLGATRAA